MSACSAATPPSASANRTTCNSSAEVPIRFADFATSSPASAIAIVSSVIFLTTPIATSAAFATATIPAIATPTPTPIAPKALAFTAMNLPILSAL